MSFLTTPPTNAVEVLNYLSLSVTESEISLLKDVEGIVEFRMSKIEMFPKLHRIGLRILVTTASSSPSERHFSLLKLLVTPGWM